MDYTNDKVFNEYLGLYEEYLRIEDLLMTSPGQQYKTKPIRVTKEDIIVDFNQNKFTINKPVYGCFSQEIDEIYRKKEEFHRIYDLEKNQIIYNGKADLKDIISLTDKINVLDKDIADLKKNMYKDEMFMANRINTIINQNNAIQKDKMLIYNKIQETNDDVEKKTNTKKYISIQTEVKPVKKLLEYSLLHDDYILSKPVIDVFSLKPDKFETKLKEKIKKTKKVFEKTEREVKDNLKNNIKKTIFATLDECNSSKRSKPYYLNKAQIIEIIEKDPELKEKLGKAYKKMSRTELCDKLFIT